MNEIRRLAYLEAMDIPTYVSRRDLPGAAPSRRLRIAAPLPAPAAAAAPGAEVLRTPPLDVPAPTRRPREAPAPVAPAATTQADTPVFAVAASTAGGWLWVDELPPGRDPGADYAQLLGFLSGRITRTEPARVVLLGELQEPWFDPAFAQDVPVTRTVSAWGMLRDSQLKARAWRDLKPLRVDA